MARKAEAPKGEEFLPGTSVADLREMAKRADNGIDSIRYMAVGLRKSGMEFAEIAKSLLTPPETIRRWITRAHREGLGGAAHRKGGSHCRLGLEQRAEVFADVTTTQPWEHGQEGKTWDDPTTRSHMAVKHGVNYSPSGAHRLIRRIGLHPMSVRPEHPSALSEKDQEARARVMRARMQGLFNEGFKTQGNADECHLRVNERPTRALGATGCPPRPVPSSAPGGVLTLFVALVEGALYVMRSRTGGNSREFIRFCDMLLGLIDKLVLLVDNASYRKSNEVSDYCKDNRDRLRLIFLPPFTPPMAVVETGMGPMKRAAARMTPRNRGEAWIALCGAAAAGGLPVNKMFDWMRIRDPDPEPKVRAPAYEYDSEMIIVRTDSLPEPPARARIKKRPKAKDMDLTEEEYGRLPKCVLNPDGTLREEFRLFPNAVLRRMPVGLSREQKTRKAQKGKEGRT